jgi:seryl-tRNA synthetase
MLDPKLIRGGLLEIAELLKKRGITLDVPRFQALEEKRKQLQTQLQQLQSERNANAKIVGQAKAQGKNVTDLLTQIKESGDRLTSTEEEFNAVQAELDTLLALLPNIPHHSVPDGLNEKFNKIIRVQGDPPTFDFTPKDHVDLGEKLGMDFNGAAKLSGARFVVLRDKLARLQRALIQFMLDIHTKEHGYQEIYVPSLIHSECLFGTGQLPKMKEDLFQIAGEQDFYLIPTSEVPVANLFRDEILELDQLPQKFVCYSSCFRSEAGSYGKDTRGMIRHHQFEKVELVQLVHPDKSYEALEKLTQHAEIILQRLELPYRVVALCGGDLGFAAAKTYDLEVWLPAQNCYREISSCSNTEAFQARRMKTRFRDASGKNEWVHTLNGSGLAVGRTLVAIIENYQDSLGRVSIPKALQSYLGGMDKIE